MCAFANKSACAVVDIINALYSERGVEGRAEMRYDGRRDVLTCGPPMRI